jgi:hypothetical protein
MKKQKFFLLIFCIVTLLSCTKVSDKDVVVLHTGDTIRIGKLFIAHIYIENSDFESPLRAYIIYKNDTFHLPYDEGKKCFVYNGRGVTSGSKKWGVNIEYYKNGKKKKGFINGAYYVKPD